ASWLMAGGNPPRACAGRESEHLLTSVSKNKSSDVPNKSEQEMHDSYHNVTVFLFVRTTN
ncbi:hypothetical protein, partial [Sporosarcina sp. P16a]|uniref:hypothetical protein n=1 Tax=Sporosarcina sp. P16a TaxID=2048262 RepID=UPI001E468351